MVYAAVGGLFLRSMSEFEARAIPGTDTGDQPGVFARWSIAGVLVRDSALKRIAVSGGTGRDDLPDRCGTVRSGLGNDSILFSQSGTTIMRVSPDGGKPEVLLDLSDRKTGLWSPTAARRRHAAVHDRETNRRGH